MTGSSKTLGEYEQVPKCSAVTTCLRLVPSRGLPRIQKNPEFIVKTQVHDLVRGVG